MKKNIYYVLIIFTSISCTLLLEGDNSPFNCNELREYNLNDKIKFSTGSDTLVFNIIDLYTAGENDEYCEISVGYETDIKNGYKLKERSGSGSYLDEEDHFLSISITENPNYEDFFKIKQKNKTDYQTDKIKVEYHRDYIHNGITYEYVIIGSKDTI